MKTVLVLLLVFSSISVVASDRWDYCVSSDGVIRLEEGVIVAPAKTEEENYVLGEQIKKILIKTRKETCILKNSRTKVISLDDETSYEVYQVNVGEYSFKEGFLCTRGGSGIPAADSCDEKTAKLVETYKVKSK